MEKGDRQNYISSRNQCDNEEEDLDMELINNENDNGSSFHDGNIII